MVMRRIAWLVLVWSAVSILSGCGQSGSRGPGDATPPAASNLDEGKLKQELPPRKPAP